MMLQASTSIVGTVVAGRRQPVLQSLAPAGRSSLRVVAFREGNKRAATKSDRSPTKGSKQRVVQAPNATGTERENKESVVTFVAVGALFLTGVLFVLPALLGGAPATTAPLQQGINKTFGIEDNSEAASVRGKSYAPGPGPAAAPGTPATQQ